MNKLLPRGLQHNLVLADGSRLIIAAGDDAAEAIVSQLSDAMQLHAAIPSAGLSPATFETNQTSSGNAPHHDIARRFFVVTDAHHPEASRATCNDPLPSEDDGSVVCVPRSFAHGDGLFIQFLTLSLNLARDAQTRGGVLLHGALAEKDGIGVILAAPGGTGKTTASGRLPAPWRSLCDDATLVVRDRQGSYWAHPWPTWSRFLDGGPGGTWAVQRAVPLRSIFFLSRALEDRVEPIGAGQAVSLLAECAKQASARMGVGMGKEEIRSLHLERFNNLCALSRVASAHLLHISLTGAFWREIEQTL